MGNLCTREALREKEGEFSVAADAARRPCICTVFYVMEELWVNDFSDEPFGKRKTCLDFPALERECNKELKSAGNR